MGLPLNGRDGSLQPFPLRIVDRHQNTAHWPPWELLAAVLVPLAGRNGVLLFFHPRLVGTLNVPEGAHLQKQRVKRRMQKNLPEAPLPFEEPLIQIVAGHRLHPHDTESRRFSAPVFQSAASTASVDSSDRSERSSPIRVRFGL